MTRPERATLAEFQASFAAALLDGSLPVPARRFAIHRNTVVLSLIEALRARFPVSLRIVGDEFFNEMARRFILASPPASPVLHVYGDGLAAFAETLLEAKEVPYLPDMLRIEAAWSEAYHAADAEPAPADALAALSGADLGEVKVVLHPSLRLVRSEHPVVSIWEMNQPDAEPRPLTEWSGEDALIVRPRLAVNLLRLSAGGFAFLDALRAGHRLGPAVETALAAAPDLDIASALAGLVSTGSATRFDV